MYTDEKLWTEIREAVLSGKLSKRKACEKYGIHWKTLTRILEHEKPPGYRMRIDRAKPVLGPYLPIIQQMIANEANREDSSRRRITAKEIFERLSQKHGYTGCRTIVQNAVRNLRGTKDEDSS